MKCSAKLALVCMFSVACFDPAQPMDESSGEESGTTPGTSGGPGSMSGETNTTGDTEDESSGSGPVACADGQGVCVAVPAGWSGPVAAAIAGGDTEPDCGGAEVSIVAHGDITSAEAICECECNGATGAECTDGRLVAWSDVACSDAEVFSQTVHPNTGMGDPCNFMPSGDATGEVPVEGMSHWSIITESSGGSCEPSQTVTIPTASFDTSVAGCAVTELDGSCEGEGTCWESPAPPFEAGVCVWRLGDEPCPTGFSSRALWYRGELEDTRACSQCICDEPVGSCPTSAVDIYEGYYCNDPVTTFAEGTCGEICYGDMCNTYAVSALFFAGPAEATCAAMGGELSGEVTATDPVTFCCTG